MTASNTEYTMIIHVYSFSLFVSSKTRYHTQLWYVESCLFTSIKRGYNDRFCAVCKSRIIEDEFHFLLHFTKYSVPRRKFYNQIQHNLVNFNQLSCTKLIIKLMNSHNFSLNSHLLKFISVSMLIKSYWWHLIDLFNLCIVIIFFLFGLLFLLIISINCNFILKLLQYCNFI